MVGRIWEREGRLVVGRDRWLVGFGRGKGGWWLVGWLLGLGGKGG